MSREMMESHSDLSAAGRSRRSQSQSPSQSAAPASVSSSHRKRKLPPSSDDHASLFAPSSLATFFAKTNDDLDNTSAAGGGVEDSDYYEGSDVTVDDDEDDHDVSSIRNFTASRLKNVGVASAAARRNKKVKIDDLVKVKTPEAGKDGGGRAARTNSDSMGAGRTALGGVGRRILEKVYLQIIFRKVELILLEKRS